MSQPNYEAIDQLMQKMREFERDNAELIQGALCEPVAGVYGDFLTVRRELQSGNVLCLPHSPELCSLESYTPSYEGAITIKHYTRAGLTYRFFVDNNAD